MMLHVASRILFASGMHIGRKSSSPRPPKAFPAATKVRYVSSKNSEICERAHVCRKVNTFQRQASGTYRGKRFKALMRREHDQQKLESFEPFLVLSKRLPYAHHPMHASFRHQATFLKVSRQSARKPAWTITRHHS
jgi:hypothetical protein